MFKFVPEDEIKIYKKFCCKKLNQLKQYLKKKGYKVDFSLIGSGVKNLVTRNANEAFDLDFNVEFINKSIKDLNPDKIKKEIINFLNSVILNNKKRNVFKNCEDSTSAITAKLIYDHKIEFSFDVAILAKNKNDDYCRLIHNKKNESYHWEELPDSANIFERYRMIKSHNHNLEFRNTYLNKKNMYLTRNDHKHCSFKVFKESVNEVFYKYFN